MKLELTFDVNHPCAKTKEVRNPLELVGNTRFGTMLVFQCKDCEQKVAIEFTFKVAER